MAKDIHEVKMAQREQATAKENRRQEHAKAIQELSDRLTQVEIQFGTMPLKPKFRKKLKPTKTWLMAQAQGPP